VTQQMAPSKMPQDENHLIYDKPGHLIRRLQQIAVAVFMAETEEFDVTPVQYAALLAVHLHPGIDQTALVNIIAYDRSTIGDVVARLESKKLIRRVPGAFDRRTKVLAVTPLGRRLIPEIEQAVLAAQELILAPLRPGERGAFVDMMKRLVLQNNDRSRAPLRRPRMPSAHNAAIHQQPDRRRRSRRVAGKVPAE
jgi:DNA-binding MarR family transcriptional regulator